MKNIAKDSMPTKQSPIYQGWWHIFWRDLWHLVWWSLLQPDKVAAYLSTVHPDLKADSGLAEQLRLIRHHPPVRRLLGLQFVIWVLTGLLAGGLIIGGDRIFDVNNIFSNVLVSSLICVIMSLTFASITGISTGIISSISSGFTVLS